MIENKIVYQVKHFRYVILIIIFLIPGLVTYSQNSSPPGFWHQQAFNGEISLEGIWRQQNSFYETSTENWRSLYGIGGIKLRSLSYLWLPGLITLDLDLELHPETRNEKYLLIPNRSEVRTLNKIGLRSTIFNDKPITLMPFYTYNQSFYNRENLTNIKSKTQQWGGTVLLKNKFLPTTLSYNDMKWRQEETETGRIFSNDRTTFESRTSWNFSAWDKNELIYGHDNFTYTYTHLDTTHNIINRVNLNDRIKFDSAGNYTFNSYINFFDQVGTYTFRRMDTYQRFLFNLPYNFRLAALYNYYGLKESSQELKQNRVRADLSHELFKSLRSNVFIEFLHSNQTVYQESNVRLGVGFDYTKKIGIGRLNLSYHYYRLHLDMNSDPSFVQIRNEPHTLTDGTIELLERPYADINSVVIKDITGTIIYQLNFDYILIERNSFIEIQRVLGGQIPNGGAVFVDYIATQPGSYQYDLNNHNVYLGFLLFDRLLEVYYRGRFQDYTNISQTDFLTLKYFSQNIVGLRFEKAFARGGVEYDNFNSNIIPYRMWRYYLNLQGNFDNKLLLTLNASLRDYKYLEDDNQQILGNLSGRASYIFKAQTRLEFEIGYLRHKAFQTDLSMWTGRLEYSTVFRQLYLNAGLDFYKRDYTLSKFTLKGVFVRLTRKF